MGMPCVMRWACHVSCVEKRNCYRVLARKSERNCLEDQSVDGQYIPVQVTELEWEGLDWVHLAQHRYK